MDTEWATESVRIKQVELCSSRKYPYPPPHTHTHTHTHAEGNGNSEGRRGVQKDAISDGVVGEVASRGFFPCLQVRLVSYPKLTTALLSKLSVILLLTIF